MSITLSGSIKIRSISNIHPIRALEIPIDSLISSLFILINYHFFKHSPYYSAEQGDHKRWRSANSVYYPETNMVNQILWVLFEFLFRFSVEKIIWCELFLFRLGCVQPCCSLLALFALASGQLVLTSLGST